MKLFKNGINLLNRIFEWAAIFFLAVTVVTCAIQVFTRYVLNNAWTGSEELARYAFIWMSSLGAGLCTQKGAHAAVTLLSEKMTKNQRVKEVYTIIIYLMIAVFAYVMIVYGFKLLGVVKRQHSAMFGIRMDLMYMAIPISGISILLNVIYVIVECLERLFGRSE